MSICMCIIFRINYPQISNVVYIVVMTAKLSKTTDFNFPHIRKLSVALRWRNVCIYIRSCASCATKIVFVSSHANSSRIEITPVLFHYFEVRDCDYYGL